MKGTQAYVWGSRWLASCVLAALLVAPAAAQVQTGDRAQPRAVYYMGLRQYYAGDYDDALNSFQSAAAQGVRTSERRWIDSICYHTMAGECYYQMGQLGDALDQYNSAVRLFITNKDWMVSVQYPASIRAANSRVRESMNWGRSQRPTQLGAFPDTMATPDNPLSGPQQPIDGAVPVTPILYPVNVTEIVRCTALAIRRRGIIMGPACQHDPLTDQAIAALAARPVPPNHWSGAWISVQLGMAYASKGDAAQAERELTSSLLINGADHPLTGLALLELGRLSLGAQQLDAAATYFYEATFPAGAYGQADVVEEAFRYGMITHLARGQQTLYPPLAPAADWARRNNYDVLRASLMISAAENLATIGNTNDAAAQINDANRAAGRSDIAQSCVGARMQYVNALVLFQQGRVPQANAAVAAAMAYMQRGGSHRLFQINMADNLFTSGGISPRVAEDLYVDTLRDPTPGDWIYEPMETMAVLLTPHILPLEHWFEVTLQRRQPERALEIGDILKRHRFYSTLPMGGRLLSLRWLLSAPAPALDDHALTQRQNLLAKFPALAQSVRQEEALRGQLAQLAPGDSDSRQREALIGQLAELGATQERLLSEIALRREPADLVFPRMRSTEEIRGSLRDGQLALVYVNTARVLYAFLFTKENYTHWQVESPRDINAGIAELLQDWRMFNANAQLDLGNLNDEDWKEPAADLLKQLSNNAAPDFWGRYEELVIVPDGTLWYLPFEALQLGVPGGATRELGSVIRIRYVPTAGLIIPDGRGRPRAGETAVVLGALYPRDGGEIASRAYDEISAVLPGCEPYREPINVPSDVLATTWSRLIVLDDIDASRGGPYDWSPTQLGSGPGNDLVGWMGLPFGHAEQVLLPGFHTAAEAGLRDNSNPGGNDVFLSVCGLMAGGSRTILLARWRPGGRTATELVREFAQELPHTSATQAWQRSVSLARASQLQPENEPRVRAVGADASATADHPFFWAAYMLVDDGSGPVADAP